MAPSPRPREELYKFTVGVFISSTFVDMQAERDRLVRFVFRRRSAGELEDLSAETANLAGLAEEDRKLLTQTQTVMESWQQELAEATRDLERKVDRVILRSGGVFRDPFRAETAIEEMQTRSVLLLRHSGEDWQKVAEALRAAAEAVDILDTSQGARSPKAIAAVRGALEAVDAAPDRRAPATPSRTRYGTDSSRSTRCDGCARPPPAGLRPNGQGRASLPGRFAGAVGAMIARKPL